MLPGSGATDLHYFVATNKFPGGDFWESWEQPREKSQGSRREGQAERGLGWGEEDAVGSEALVEGDLSF